MALGYLVESEGIHGTHSPRPFMEDGFQNACIHPPASHIIISFNFIYARADAADSVSRAVCRLYPGRLQTYGCDYGSSNTSDAAPAAANRGAGKARVMEAVS